ncbi:MAG: hypothetical protein K6U09_10375 [Acidobacteriia bacterium]|jgi:hypothetical protein|nr:hypothetical protein [Terriglobia bacterium]
MRYRHLSVRMAASAHVTIGLLGLVGFSMMQQSSAPARDSHQGVTVTADPYTDAQRSRERFGKKHPHQVGLLAIEVVIRNENTQPVRVALDQIRLVLDLGEGPRQRLAPLSLEETALALLQKRPETQRRPFPVPGRIPTSPRGKDWEEMERLLQSLWLEMDIIPPGATAQGFLFFDLQGRFHLLERASLYFPELYFLRDGRPLMFFEVHLGRPGA